MQGRTEDAVLVVTNPVVFSEAGDDITLDLPALVSLVGESAFSQERQGSVWEAQYVRYRDTIIPAIISGSIPDSHAQHEVTPLGTPGDGRAVLLSRIPGEAAWRTGGTPDPLAEDGDGAHQPRHHPIIVARMEGDPRTPRYEPLATHRRNGRLDPTASESLLALDELDRRDTHAAHAAYPTTRFISVGPLAGSSVRITIGDRDFLVPRQDITNFLFEAGPLPSAIRPELRSDTSSQIVALRGRVERSGVGDLESDGRTEGYLGADLLSARLATVLDTSVYLDDRPDLAVRNMARIPLVRSLQDIAIIDDRSIPVGTGARTLVMTTGLRQELLATGARLVSFDEARAGTQGNTIVLALGVRNPHFNEVVVGIETGDRFLLELSCGEGGEPIQHSEMLSWRRGAPIAVGYFRERISPSAARAVLRSLVSVVSESGYVPQNILTLFRRAVERAAQQPSNRSIRPSIRELLQLIPQVSWRSLSSQRGAYYA